MQRNVREEHRQKLWAIIERDFSASLMNTTKWAEALNALRDLRLQYRAKLIRDAGPTRWGSLWSGEQARLPIGYVEGCVGTPVHVLEIEWLEIEPFTRIRQGRLVADKRIDHTQEIEERLGLVGAPFSWHDGVIRIWGHVRR